MGVNQKSFSLLAFILFYLSYHWGVSLVKRQPINPTKDSDQTNCEPEDQISFTSSLSQFISSYATRFLPVSLSFSLLPNYQHTGDKKYYSLYRKKAKLRYLFKATKDTAMFGLIISFFLGSSFLFALFRPKLFTAWLFSRSNEQRRLSLEETFTSESSPKNVLYSPSDSRDKTIKELDGELIASHSYWLEIRQKRLRVVDIPHDLGNEVPLLVFIHGFGGQASQWQNQIVHFSRLCNILALDLVGHGASEVSDRIEDYSLDSIVDDVIILLAKFENAHLHNMVLVAHSYGTMVAVKVRQKLPHLICGLSLIAPVRSLSGGAGKKSWVTKLPSAWLDAIRQVDRIGGTKSVSVSRVLHETASEDIRIRQLGWNSTSHSVVVQNMLRLGGELDNTVYRSLLNVPLLLIGGSNDSISPLHLLYDLHRFSLPQSNENHASQSQNSGQPKQKTSSKNKNVLPSLISNCGHNPMVEKPDDVNELIAGFIISNCRLNLQSASKLDGIFPSQIQLSDSQQPSIST